MEICIIVINIFTQKSKDIKLRGILNISFYFFAFFIYYNQIIVNSETNTVPDDFVEKYAFKKMEETV